MKKIVVHFIPNHHKYVQELLVRLKLIDNISVACKKTKYVSVAIIINSDIEETYDNLIVIISSYILKAYKRDYFNQNTRISKQLENCKTALVKSLVGFDFENELFYLSGLIDDYEEIYTDSLYFFKMQKLQMKWGEFSCVVNLSTKVEQNPDLYIEFLRFLSSNKNDDIMEVNLHIKDNSYLLCDNNQNLLCKITGLKDTIGLATILVNLSPKVINIYNFTNMNRDTFKSLYYIFSTKINMLV